MRVVRHGDIMFREVKKLPEGPVIECGDTFRQHGETGKFHEVKGVRSVTVKDRPFIITPANPVEITHPEHPPKILPGNTIFRITRVRVVEPEKFQYID
jgi:hypothetical protein